MTYIFLTVVESKEMYVRLEIVHEIMLLLLLHGEN